MGNAYFLNVLRKLWNLEGGVMVWGMISFAEVGPIVGFHSKIKASVYKELLRQQAVPHLRKGTAETPIFMWDNVPCHKVKTVSFLEEEGIAVMKWPPQSLDMNPPENVWKNHRRESLEEKSTKY